MIDDIPTSANSVSNGEQNNQEYVHKERFFELLSPATSNQAIWLGILGAVIFFGVWEIGNLITPESGRKFLPSVETVIGRLFYLFTEKGFIKDVLISCLPETEETIGILDISRLSKLKRDALFVNVGRGSVVEVQVLWATRRWSGSGTGR